jgi:hypothetical protein
VPHDAVPVPVSTRRAASPYFSRTAAVTSIWFVVSLVVSVVIVASSRICLLLATIRT